MIVKMLKSTMFLAVLAMAGCATTSHSGRSAYQEYIEKRPAAGYVKTDDAKVDEIGAETAVLYGSVVKLLDDYVAATEGNRTYQAFVNDTNGMSLDEMETFYKGLSQEDQSQIDAAQEMDGLRALIKVADMLVQADRLGKAANHCSSAFSGFDATTVTKVKSVKNMVAQANYSLKTLTFLKQQHDIMVRLKEHKGR